MCSNYNKQICANKLMKCQLHRHIFIQLPTTTCIYMLYVLVSVWNDVIFYALQSPDVRITQLSCGTQLLEQLLLLLLLLVCWWSVLRFIACVVNDCSVHIDGFIRKKVVQKYTHGWCMANKERCTWNGTCNYKFIPTVSDIPLLCFGLVCCCRLVILLRRGNWNEVFFMSGHRLKLIFSLWNVKFQTGGVLHIFQFITNFVTKTVLLCPRAFKCDYCIQSQFLTLEFH